MEQIISLLQESNLAQSASVYVVIKAIIEGVSFIVALVVFFAVFRNMQKNIFKNDKKERGINL